MNAVHGYAVDEGRDIIDDMTLRKKNILITGQPGIGKTTLVRKLAAESKTFHYAGFYTAEIRERGIRKGFEMISLSGQKGILSRADIKSPYRVGKYGVDIEGFEAFLDSISFFIPETDLVVIDEIGKMECFSDKFKRLLERVLGSDKIVIATISLRGSGIIEEIKRRDDVMLYEMTYANRDSLPAQVLNTVAMLIGSE